MLQYTVNVTGRSVHPSGPDNARSVATNRRIAL